MFKLLKFLKLCWKKLHITIKNEAKEQKRRLLRMLLGTLGASLLGNMLAEKGIIRAAYRNKEGKEMLRAGYGSKNNFSFRLIL